MLSYALKKYFKGFHNFLPFLVINLVLNLISLKIFDLQFGGSSLMRAINLGEEIDWNTIASDPKSQGLTITIFVVIGVMMLIGPILNSYITLVIKKLLDKEEINHGHILKESFKFYFPYLGVMLAIFLMILGLAIVTGIVAVLIPVLGIIGAIAGGIFIIYLAVTYTPSVSYLIYYNSTISEALHYGKEVGKKYFWRIFGFLLVVNIVNKIVSLPDSSNIMAYIIATLLTLAISILNTIYMVTLCKGYKNPEIEYDNDYQ